MLDKGREWAYNTANVFRSVSFLEITGTNSLWKDYDVDALPFNATMLSGRTENGVVIRELYFNGFATVDGMVRAFLRIYEAPDAKGIILYLPDEGVDPEIRCFLENGYTVAALDYRGVSDGKYTIYPMSLTGCNAIGKKEFEADGDALSSCWFIWTCVARRAVRYLGEFGLPIFAFGKGLGGCTVYKLCAFDDGLKAAATLLNIMPEMHGTSAQLINYRAALDNNAYAPITAIPLYMAVSSNAEDGSLDKMSELVRDTASVKTFRIIERAFNDGIIKAFPHVSRFFDGYLDGEPTYPRTEIKAVNSDNKLYFEIKTDAEQEKTTVKLFAAFCIKDASYRNWTQIKLMRLAGGEYMAHVDVLQDDKPVYAFVNTENELGDVCSSTLLTVTPKNLGIPRQSAVNRRLIYDGSMGTDVWASPNNGTVTIKNGAFDIEGISSDSNHLVTFKPGDLLYRADGDVMLQILVCGSRQKLNVGIYDGKEKFYAQVEIPGPNEYHKFTLSLSDFKGQGLPDDFSSVIMLELFSDEEFIVSSVLWV